ncbi:MAG: glycosyltransferase family 9 protein [Deltaproteobacteria bacterium]|nr:glycosyltransferase family 9 protein [Deltaproteobacteria bacterium]
MSIESAFPTASRIGSGRILVIFPGALGDFLCFLPALGRLAAVREVDLFARSEYGEILPSTIRTRSLECREISRLFTNGADHNAELRQFFAHYERLYSWMASSQPTFVANLSSLSNGRLKTFPFRPREWRQPMAAYYLSCLGESPPPEPLARVVLREDALEWSVRFRRMHGLANRRALGLAPGSGSKEKNWPIEFFTAVARWWRENIRGQVLAFLGPAETAIPEAESLYRSALVVRNESLGKVAALLSRCDLYLGNDSGLTHLAAALGIATVALFGPSDPILWAPQGRRVIVAKQNVACSPCSDRDRKACPHRMCLTRLGPDKVIADLEGLLRADSPTASRP